MADLKKVFNYETLEQHLSNYSPENSYFSSQKEAAKKFGFSESKYSRIVNGKRPKISVNELAKICSVLGKKPNYFFKDDLIGEM